MYTLFGADPRERAAVLRIRPDGSAHDARLLHHRAERNFVAGVGEDRSHVAGGAFLRSLGAKIVCDPSQLLAVAPRDPEFLGRGHLREQIRRDETTGESGRPEQHDIETRSHRILRSSQTPFALNQSCIRFQPSVAAAGS